MEETGIGKGGDIRITTEALSVTNGARFIASTRGKGDAGNVTITTRDSVSFNQGYAITRVEETGIGKGGDIHITTGDISLTNTSQLIASNRGQGDAGSAIAFLPFERLRRNFI